MGLRAKIFGLSDREAYMLSNQSKASLTQELRQYKLAEERSKEQIESALNSGNKSLANQLAGSIAKYRAKVNALQGEISDIEAVNMHAFSKMNEQQRAGIDMSGLIKYGTTEAQRLTALKEPYAVKLREAVNGLAKSQETNAAAMGGLVSEAYVPETAKTVLEEVVAEIETKKQGLAARKDKVKEAKEAAKEAEGA